MSIGSCFNLLKIYSTSTYIVKVYQKKKVDVIFLNEEFVFLLTLLLIQLNLDQTKKIQIKQKKSKIIAETGKKLLLKLKKKIKNKMQTKNMNSYFVVFSSFFCNETNVVAYLRNKGGFTQTCNVRFFFIPVLLPSADSEPPKGDISIYRKVYFYP